MFAISFEHVSKHFRGAGYRMLRDDVGELTTRLLRRHPVKRNVVRALEDVSFEIPEGQSSALIGLNGAGKTTALKIATRIAYPTSGKVRVRGRIGALIEVGTGMHPELTGRENVQLYGRILGLTRRDIRDRFDRIVEFAEIGEALDRPVKQFSSGMQLRLGFSLAAHLEPDVLLVDEAIAVGDAGFQYRCVERMGELVREGRTLVFVSHNMSAIETLCDRAILLRDGRVAADGTAQDVVREYLLGVQADLLARDSAPRIAAVPGRLDIFSVSILDAAGLEVDEVAPGAQMTARLHYRAREPILEPIFEVGISDGRAGCFTLASMLVDGQVPARLSGEGYVDCTFAELPLRPRTYELWAAVRGREGFGDLFDWQRIRVFRIGGGIEGPGKGAVTHSLLNAAPVVLPYSWSYATEVEDEA